MSRQQRYRALLYEGHRDELRTQPRDYPTWFDRTVTSLTGSTSHVAAAGVIAGIAGAVYAAGAAISASSGFAHVYFSSLPPYLGVIGLAWTLASLRLFSTLAHPTIFALRPALAISDAEFEQWRDLWFRRYIRPSPTLISWLILYGLGTVLVVVAYAAPGLFEFLRVTSLPPSTFPDAWFAEPHRWSKMSILLVFGMPCSLAMGGALWLLLVTFAMLLSLRRKQVVPIPAMVRVRFRRAVHFYSGVSTVWLAGGSLFLIFFGADIDWLSLAVLAVIGVVGFGLFIVPQIVFRSLIDKMQLLVGDEILSRSSGHSRSLSSPWLREESGMFLGSLSDSDLLELASQRTPSVYEVRDVLLALAGQGVVLVSLAAG